VHIPDAVLSPAVALTTGLVGAGGLMVCLWRLRDQLGERTPVLMGTMSAFVFAAQMVRVCPTSLTAPEPGGIERRRRTEFIPLDFHALTGETE
jgi:ABC-type Co2+ transport system permease subunit